MSSIPLKHQTQVSELTKTQKKIKSELRREHDLLSLRDRLIEVRDWANAELVAEEYDTHRIAVFGNNYLGSL